MKTTKKEAPHENLMSALLSTIFLLLTLLLIVLLLQTPHKSLDSISPFEFIILALAAYRLTRLMVYDSIMTFVRDLFTTKKISKIARSKQIKVTRNKPALGLRRKLYELLACPWCAGVWISLFVVGTYLLIPASWPLFLILAIAGTASFLQLTINNIGWKAEYTKNKVINGSH